MFAVPYDFGQDEDRAKGEAGKVGENGMNNIDKNLTIKESAQPFRVESNLPVELSMKTHNGMTIRRCDDVRCFAHVNLQAEIFIVFSGKVRAVSNGRETVISAGEAFFVNSLEVHAFFAEGESSAAVVMFNISEFPAIEKRTDGYTAEPNITKLTEKKTDEIKRRMTEDEDTVFYDEVEIASLIYPLFSEIFRQNVLRKSCDAQSSETLIKAMKIILEKYDTDITLEKVAHMVGIHPIHLGRCIKKRLGEGFVDILSSIRVDKAIRMLTSGDEKISDIAYLCGFGSVRNFNRVFLKICKITPSQWRAGRR